MSQKPLTPFSLLDRLLVWLRRYLRFRDFLQLFLVILAYSFLVATYFFHPQTALIAGGIYSIIALAIGVDIIRGRKGIDYTEAKVLQEFFIQLSQEVFKADKNIRITLFKQSFFNKDYIIPWYRYKRGEKNVIKSALRSRAKYLKGEGFTGDAWENKGQDLTCASFPEFNQSREAFEEYYIKQLHINSDTAHNLSSVMLDVRTILSYGFESSTGEFLGVISIDLQVPIEVDEETKAPRIGESYLYADTLMQTLRSINIVLEAFVKAERRKL